MLFGIIESESLLSDLEPPLDLSVGFTAVEYEDEVATIAAAQCRNRLSQTLVYADVRQAAVEAVSRLGQVTWSEIELELRRLLMAGALEIARQVVPAYRREF